MILKRIAPAAAALLIAAPAALQAAPLPKPAPFAACGVCHKVDQGAKAGLGPTLWGVGGSKAGELPGFAFSPAMKSSGIVWNRDNLIRYITDPKKTVPGNKMAYVGQKNPQLAAQIADYLLSLK